MVLQWEGETLRGVSEGSKGGPPSSESFSGGLRTLGHLVNVAEKIWHTKKKSNKKEGTCPGEELGILAVRERTTSQAGATTFRLLRTSEKFERRGSIFVSIKFSKSRKFYVSTNDLNRIGGVNDYLEFKRLHSQKVSPEGVCPLRSRERGKSEESAGSLSTEKSPPRAKKGQIILVLSPLEGGGGDAQDDPKNLGEKIGLGK